MKLLVNRKILYSKLKQLFGRMRTKPSGSSESQEESLDLSGTENRSEWRRVTMSISEFVRAQRKLEEMQAARLLENAFVLQPMPSQLAMSGQVLGAATGGITAGGIGSVGGFGGSSTYFCKPWTEPAEHRDIPGPIIALRGWLRDEVLDNDLRLKAVGIGTIWHPGECKRATSFPGPSGGYWGLRFSEDIPTQAEIAGIVAMWGKIIPHEKGFRSEYAYPLVIWPNHKEKCPMPGFPVLRDEYCNKLAEIYGIEALDRAPWEEPYPNLKSNSEIACDE